MERIYEGMYIDMALATLSQIMIIENAMRTTRNVLTA